jgi:hypothetical protein
MWSLAMPNGQPVGKLLGQLQNQVVAAFDEPALAALLLTALEKRLDRITSANGLDAKVLDVIEAAQREGWMLGLLLEIRTRRPDAPALQAAVADLLHALKAQSPPSAVQIADRLGAIRDLPGLRNEVRKLQQEAALDELSTLTNRLGLLLSVKNREPDLAFLSALLGLVLQMQADRQDGASLDEVIEKALRREGLYENPAWDPNGLMVSQAFHFQDVVRQLQAEKTKVYPVAVVLVAMTVNEAQALADGSAFNGHLALQAAFQELRQVLENSGLADWSARYGAHPQDWRPFGPKRETIEEIIDGVLFQVGADYASRLVPYYIDLHRLDKSHPAFYEQLQRLRREGCFVIADVISLRHPELHRSFYASRLDAFDKTRILEVAPVAQALDLRLNLMLALEQELDEEFRRRRDFDDKPSCRTAADQEGLRDWFGQRVGDLVPAELRRKQDIRSYSFGG